MSKKKLEKSPKSVEVRRFIVERSKWYRGKGPEKSALLVEGSVLMCCLGFLSLACGLKKQQIRGVTMVDQLVGQLEVRNRPEELEFLVRETKAGLNTSRIAMKLMQINDDEFLSEKEREKRLTKWFAKKNIQVEFVD